MNSQPPRRYVKSSRSGGSGGNCVQWAFEPEGVYVSDSKDPGGPELLVDYAEWDRLLRAVCTGGEHPWISREPGAVAISKDGHRLSFTAAEWVAFEAAALDGECLPVTV
jgi:hypothetical protein